MILPVTCKIPEIIGDCGHYLQSSDLPFNDMLPHRDGLWPQPAVHVTKPYETPENVQTGVDCGLNLQSM